MVDSEAETVRSIFDLRANGCTLQEIADTLNAAGHRTTRGASFSPVQVSRVLDRRSFHLGEGVLARTYETEKGAHVAILRG